MPTAHRAEILHFLDDPATHGDAAAQHHTDGALLVDDGHIIDCDDFAAVMARAKKDGAQVEVVNHPHSLIIPGMVDTHIHYPQCEIIAAPGAQLLEWLTRYTFPAEARFASREHADHIAAFFLDELLRNGTTTALVFGSVHRESVDAFFAASEARNLRMICGKVMMDCNAPPEICDTPQSSFDDSQQLIATWHGKGRLGYAVTPRFAPTSSPQQLTLAGQLLTQHPGVHLHTHLAENVRECEWVGELFPACRDYLDVYEQHDLLGRRSVFAHGIHLQPREWTQLAASDSNIAHCPTSNLFIGSGLFSLQSADQHRVRVGFATDVGGGDSFSMLRVINEAYKVQQLQQYELSPLRALYFATLGGARALDLQDSIGNFTAGKEADFITLNTHATPLIKLRTATCTTLPERLFVLQMLGDDRAISSVWIMGERVTVSPTVTV